METIRRNRRSIIIAFILSLLFHASFMIYILWQRTDPINNMPISTPEEIIKRETKQNDNSWAETKARASNFGAPVFFKDKPQPEKEETTEQEQPETKTPELERNIDIPSSSVETSADREEITPHVAPQEAITIQRPRRTRQPREKEEQPVQRQPQRAMPQPTQPQPITISTPKQLPTLAQLTQGFMSHVKHGEGRHLVSMGGQKKGLPSDEQIKYERYLQKLDACITNSFNIHRGEFTTSKIIENDTYIFIALNQDGTQRQISLARSSGNKELDTFILFVVRDASSSFPPVPHYLPHDPFMINYIAQNKTQERNNITIRMR